MNKIEKKLFNQKASSVTTGIGKPSNVEGSSGSISIRDINGQITLFAKYGNTWYGRDLGPALIVGDTHLKHVAVDRTGINIKDGKTSFASFGEEIKLLGAIDGTAFTQASCVITEDDATISHPLNVNTAVGMSVTGTGIPDGSTIVTRTSNTRFELSTSSGLTAGTVTLTFSKGATEVFNVSSEGKVTINSTADTSIGLDVTGTADRVVTIRANISGSTTNNKLYIGTSSSVATGGSAYLNMFDGGGALDRGYLRITSRAQSDWAIGHVDDSDDFIIAETLSEKFKLDSSGNCTFNNVMIGCTHVFGSGILGRSHLITSTFACLVWDTDKYALVTFVVPLSNKVKISVHLPYVDNQGQLIQLGLATENDATSLGTKYENDVHDSFRSGIFNLNYSWVIDGSDHTWCAGDTRTIYIMAHASTADVAFWTGGTNTSEKAGVIVEAIGLPTTTGDGSEP